MPIRMRDSAFSFAASDKLEYERSRGDASVHVLPAGSVRLQALKRMWSLPKNSLSTSAAAPPWTACPESWSGNG